jgi:phospholipid/cholesterol/gamma-HCH transport system substrate-binding protein
VRDLSKTIRRRGKGNDLINFLDSFRPLVRIAVDSADRNGKTRRGAFPESVDAFNNARPVLGVSRPYTTDFLGWLDDFSTTGGGFDALGAYARAHIGLFENVSSSGIMQGPIRRGQYKRCPGGAEEPAPDGSNVLSAEERARLKCNEADRGTGPVG